MIIFLNKEEANKLNLKDLLNQVSSNHNSIKNTIEENYAKVDCKIIEQHDSAKDNF